MPRDIAVIAKPVGSRCNMNCAYCYYLEKGQFSTSKKQTRMSFSLLEKLIKQTIEANEGPVVSFVWHGGEPTLAGLDFYKQVVAIEKKYLPKGWQAWNNLQTNGLIINDEWCKFLRDNRFDVGLSIDGDKLTHDKNRRDKGGNPTYDRIYKAAQKLKAYGIMPDLLCTVNAETVKNPLEVYRALRALDTGWAQFIPVVVRDENGNIDPISVTPEAYGDFLCDVFDQWVKNDLGKLDIQLFAETAKVWAGGKAGVCHLAETCGQVLVCEEDGSIYACDHFVDNEHRLGNLMANNMAKLAHSERQIAFGNAKKDSLTDECKACPYLNVCNGGCPKDRFGENGQYYLCKGLKKYFAHADAPLHKVMEMSRKGMKPDEIMKNL
ncbi:MAG: anaerobic sulfatase maturase [Ruminococcaceae bacterium]|nr:anaerobic sulfatase maturase [Oscillospiraceae bacterium]